MLINEAPKFKLCLKELDVQSMAFPREWENYSSLERIYNNGEVETKFMPAFYQIEPTNNCNLRCIMCPNREMENTALLDFDLFKKIINEVGKYALTIKLSYLGEPLLHPQICEMISYVKAHSKAMVVLFTNGVLMNHAMSVKVVQAGVDEVVFSIDGYSKQTYEEVRNGADFTQVVKNVKDFILYSSGARNTPPKVLINFVKLKQNKKEEEQFRQFWESFGCSVRFSWLSTWGGHTEIAMLSNDRCPNANKDRVPCTELWYKSIINSEGNVIQCCNDFLGRHLLGDLKVSSMYDIWNGEKINKLRRLHLAHIYNRTGICRKCKEWANKDEMKGYLPNSKFRTAKP